MDTRGRSCERVSEFMAEARTSLRCRRTIGSWTPATILRTPSSPPFGLISLPLPPRELRRGECRRKFHCSHRDRTARIKFPPFRTRHIPRLCGLSAPQPCYFQKTEPGLFAFEALRRRISWSSASLLSDVISAKGVKQLDCGIFFFPFCSRSSSRDLPTHKSLPAPSPKLISP